MPRTALNPEQIVANPHFKRAMRDYVNAREMVKQGTLGNAVAQREQLRWTYRFLAGKH